MTMLYAQYTHCVLCVFYVPYVSWGLWNISFCPDTEVTLRKFALKSYLEQLVKRHISTQLL